ncbi:MAG: CTP-dependent riboflavin kinase [archaeon]|nr:CTP-dependent riboflavin kinase [archaeon]
MKAENLALALLLAKKGALYGEALVSTSSLAQLTGFSQQSISRKLRELESEGTISRNVSNSGIGVSFTDTGRGELESFHFELKELFSMDKPVLKGTVVSGLGEGAYYVCIPGYKKSFEKILGKNIFCGTLNLEVEPSARAKFTSAKPITIDGFTTKERTFGGIDAWKCTILSRPGKKISALAILPHRTNHPANIIEVVAPQELRKKLGLADGSKISLERV